MEVNLGIVLRKKLATLEKMGCTMELVVEQKKGNPEVLGICDVGDTEETEVFSIKAIPIILGKEDKAIGEQLQPMELGNNPEKYFEFLEVLGKEKITSNHHHKSRTGDSVIYQEERYLIEEILPVVLGGTLVCRQYKARKVL